MQTQYDYITRDEAIQEVGLEAVIRAENDSEGVEFSHFDRYKTVAFFTSHAHITDDCGYRTVTVVYEQDPKLLEETEENKDMTPWEVFESMDWEIAGYWVD